MSINIPTWFNPQYKTNVEHLLQQKDSRFAQAVTQDTYHGDSGMPVNQIGTATATKKTVRGGDTVLSNTPKDRRWVYPSDYEWADLIDTEDKLKAIVDPTSPYAEAGRMAMARAKDDEIIAAFFADAKTGQTGATTTSFPTSTQQVAAGGAGLTVTKLRAAKKILMAAEVDLDSDPLFCAIDADKHDDLLADIQVTSRDFNDEGRPVLKEGKVTQFMGFIFIHSERLLSSGGNLRVPAWAKSGMHLGTWNELFTDIGPRRDKSAATQVLVKGSYGATRTQEKKIVEILCA